MWPLGNDISSLHPAAQVAAVICIAAVVVVFLIGLYVTVIKLNS